MGQYFVGDFGDPRKHRSDIEHTGDRAQQFHRAVDVLRALALDGGVTRLRSQPLVRQRHGDVAGQTLHEGQILRRVRTGTMR